MSDRTYRRHVSCVLARAVFVIALFPSAASTVAGGQEKKVLWLNFPKCGTSFLNTVKDYPWFPGRGDPRHYYEHMSLTSDLSKKAEETKLAEQHSVAVMFRDPDERLLSSYWWIYEKHCHGGANGCCNIDWGWDLDTAKEVKAQIGQLVPPNTSIGRFSGCMTRMVLGSGCMADKPMSELDVSDAIERLDRFLFVGELAEWHLSMCLFNAIMNGGERFVLQKQVLNSRPTMQLTSCRGAPIEQGLKSMPGFRVGDLPRDSADHAVYSFARDRFRRDLARYNITTEKDCPLLEDSEIPPHSTTMNIPEKSAATQLSHPSEQPPPIMTSRAENAQSRSTETARSSTTTTLPERSIASDPQSPMSFAVLFAGSLRVENDDHLQSLKTLLEGVPVFVGTHTEYATIAEVLCNNRTDRMLLIPRATVEDEAAELRKMSNLYQFYWLQGMIRKFAILRSDYSVLVRARTDLIMGPDFGYARIFEGAITPNVLYAQSDEFFYGTSATTISIFHDMYDRCRSLYVNATLTKEQAKLFQSPQTESLQAHCLSLVPASERNSFLYQVSHSAAAQGIKSGCKTFSSSGCPWRWGLITATLKIENPLHCHSVP